MKFFEGTPPSPEFHMHEVYNELFRPFVGATMNDPERASSKTVRGKIRVPRCSTQPSDPFCLGNSQNPARAKSGNKRQEMKPGMKARRLEMSQPRYPAIISETKERKKRGVGKRINFSSRKTIIRSILNGGVNHQSIGLCISANFA